jgi:hypothetical protein
MFFRSPKANALNAQIEGEDVLEEQEPPREEARAVLTKSDLFLRLDKTLRCIDSALVAIEQPRSSPLDEPAYLIFECELKDGGRVKLIDLVARGKKLGIIEDCETVIDSYPFSLVPK